GKVIGSMPQGVLYFEQSYFPFEKGGDLDNIHKAFAECMWTAVESPPGPLVKGPEGAEKFAAGAKKLRENTDRAIIGVFGGDLLGLGQLFYRHDNFFMLLAADPAGAHRFLDKVMEIHLANLEEFMKAVGPYIDIILFVDDFGTQSGPQISPAMFREFFKPRQQLMWQRAKELGQVKTMLHCCGGVRELIADMIDAGLDAINPIQISCAGMDAAELKKEFGSDITLWGGGCDTRDTLPKATPREIKEHVKKQIEILSPGGGFVFQQVHNILADIPPENITAMFEAVNECR
ncbi:MAG: uroporphyrinogen decarboxylase family protein, partial [Gemmatimonadota bacterium]|nr:uroporphyrinogen decarboxylase family protein [Gemmatimonadota bacterium]